jgi:ParB family transcriptional regulator, chromosome partitioning protein
MKRKDALREMLAPISEQTRADQRPMKPMTKPGSLKAMGLSLQSLSDEADEAQALREQLAAGDRVVELDPNLIEPSFIRDRLTEPNGRELDELRASITEHGQQVPILVRPSPEREGYYQVAFGHRRVEALRSLDKSVKAIVRQLSDEELVIAQGKENLERRDLSFIERALFAARLEDRGFERSALIAALSVHKGNLSTMIAVVRAVPETLITAIGPAPKVGRPRWDHLAALLQAGSLDWRTLIASRDFLALDSDARFDYILRIARPKQPARQKQYVRAHDGRLVADIEQVKDQVRLTINEKSTSAFGAYLIGKLPELYEAFRRLGDG